MTGTQTLLIIVIVMLTGLLSVIGVQIFMVILDLRRAIKRLNSILEDSIMGGGLLRPEKMTGILEAIRNRKVTETQTKGQV